MATKRGGADLCVAQTSYAAPSPGDIRPDHSAPCRRSERVLESARLRGMLPRGREAALGERARGGLRIVCLDLEGVLVPEIWVALAERTGVDALRATTRDMPDYDALMRTAWACSTTTDSASPTCAPPPPASPRSRALRRFSTACASTPRSPSFRTVFTSSPAR